MRTDRKISFSIGIEFFVKQGSEIMQVEELKEYLKTCVREYYPDSNPYVSVRMNYFIWDEEDDE